MPENNFTKTLLQSYIITNCERRLFFELGKNKPHLWFNPVRTIPLIPPERQVFQTKFLTDKGTDYEQIVYSHLKRLPEVKFKESKKNGKDFVVSSFIDPQNLENSYDDLLKDSNKVMILLEHQFNIPQVFFENIFTHKSPDYEMPVDYGEQRPDVILFGNGINKFTSEIYELTSSGNVRQVLPNELKSRIGVSIFDIKYVQEEKVAKKHFLEIYYYLITFATYLYENKLDSKFFIRANFNGIIPLRSNVFLKSINNIDDFSERLVTRIRWKEASRIFKDLIDLIGRLWLQSPCPIENVELNLHQGCGYCRYFEDCKNTLGMKDGSDPRDWSSQLLPLTSHSIAQQLSKEYNLKTIGEVYDKIDSISIGSIPKPLYSELPMLKMKAEALIYNRQVLPSFGQIHSYAIPRYSPIAINIDVEYDQNNDRIFGIGIYLKMFINAKLPYHAVFDNWWRIWKNALEKKQQPLQIKNELQKYLIREIPIEVIIQFKSIFRKLKKIQIISKDESNKIGTKIEYNFVSINKDTDDKNEAILITNTIRRLNLLLNLCNIVEDYAVVDGFQSGTFFGPSTSIFYWSRNQLDHFQNMMERHLRYIIGNPKALNAYNSIMMYLNPTETEVSHPYQHKKLFDIQAFVSSCIGFPDVINYTWHGIASKLFNYHGNPKFWVPHFNFLDLTNWLRFLSKTNLNEREQVEKEIKRQIFIKLRYIDGIRGYFQRHARQALSEYSNVIGRTEYRNVILPKQYHDIAHVWYLFSKLTNTLQQQDDEYYRTMFPQFSISKLFAAKIDNLDIHHLPENAKQNYYSFETQGLSSNMKVSEGDAVLLIPNYKRSMKTDGRIWSWVVYIDSIIWNSSIMGNMFTTKPTYSNVFDKCREDRMNPNNEEWFIYPLSSDPWSNKLFNQNGSGLLDREAFGRSWLGFRLAYLWNIRTDPHLLGPPKLLFQTPVVYLYAPHVLDGIRDSPRTSLATRIYPTPDQSQQEAILNSLTYPISGILGPPGTGKSQTIAALIDEFIVRKREQGAPFKILVCSFSYAALRVVIEKIRTSKDINMKPTPSSQTQMVFIRSETQDVIESKKGCRDIEDLVRVGNAWRLNGQKRVVTASKSLEDSLEESFIIFANAHQLFYLQDRVKDGFAFDLICVDEASQLPADYFMSCLQYIYHHSIEIKTPDGSIIPPDTIIDNYEDVKNIKLVSSLSFDELTKIVIVGDHNQLPPVRVKSPPKNLELILDSLFSYYISGHQIPSNQLRVNYRSHQDIVDFTSLLGLYKTLKADTLNAESLLKGNISNIEENWIKEILAPERVVCSITHFRKFEIGISEFEANIVTKIIIGFYQMVSPQNKKEERLFWTKKIGVVAPHNAQGNTIIRNLYQHFRGSTNFSQTKLMEFLKNSIYSVEKFQGSDRDLIITSIGLSDKEKISSEEEFIYDLNRFNVLTSRAKHKVIFISSAEFLRYIPEDRKVLENASKMYLYVKEFCNEKLNLRLKNEFNKDEIVEFRYKK